MPIPKQDRRKPEPLKTNLHPDVIAQLDSYCEAQESDRDYVVEHILKAFFEEEERLEKRSGSPTKKRGRKSNASKPSLAA